VALFPDPNHVEILRSGPPAWNAWREKNPSTVPELAGIALKLSERQMGPTNGGPINLKSARLQNAFLRFGTLLAADLEAAEMPGVDLVHARLGDANLSSANLSEALLDYADFAGANLAKVNLCGASLRFATLSTADLEFAEMSGADLMHARFDYANLSAANLSNALLDHADFAGANLAKVNLCGARLYHAKNLTQAQLDESTGSDATILPPHLQGTVSWSRAQSPRIQRHDLRPLPRVTADADVSQSSYNVQRWRVGALCGGVTLVITALVWHQMNEIVPLDTLGEQRGLEQSLDAGNQGLQPTAPEARTDGKVTVKRRLADPELPPMPSGASTVDQIGSTPEKLASDTDSVIVSGETNAFDNPGRSMKAFGPNEHIAAPVSPAAPAVVSRHAIVPDLPAASIPGPQVPAAAPPTEALAANTPDSSSMSATVPDLPDEASIPTPQVSAAADPPVDALVPEGPQVAESDKSNPKPDRAATPPSPVRKPVIQTSEMESKPPPEVLAVNTPAPSVASSLNEIPTHSVTTPALPSSVEQKTAQPVLPNDLETPPMPVRKPILRKSEVGLKPARAKGGSKHVGEPIVQKSAMDSKPDRNRKAKGQSFVNTQVQQRPGKGSIADLLAGGF